MALKLRIESRHAELIQVALDDKEAGDQHPIYARIMRALKGRNGTALWENIVPATTTTVDRATGQLLTHKMPGFPQRTWAYKDEIAVSLTPDQASIVKGALAEIAKKRRPHRQDGSGGEPYVSAAQADTMDDLLSVIVPAWEKGAKIEPPEPLWWDSQAVHEIADGKSEEKK